MTLQEINQIDKENKLDKFDCATAIKIINNVYEHCKNEGINVVILIEFNGKQVASLCMDGCTSDNLNWARRKLNTAKHFEKSTLFLNEKQKGNIELLPSKYGLNNQDFTFVPGAICLYNDRMEIQGYLAISGLLPEEDDEMARFAIKSLTK